MASEETTTLAELRRLVQRFVDEREWGAFHAPKNLAMALAIEAAELMEHFQWIDVDASRQIRHDSARVAEVADELADVFAYLLSLATALDIDLSAALRAKMIKNAAKYPVGEFRGRYEKRRGTESESRGAESEDREAGRVQPDLAP